jgi:putative DNA primase/helicase
MATATSVSAGYLEYTDELIAKLVGGSEEALATVVKLEDKLTFISRQRNLENSSVLAQILDYQRKFKTLPSWNDLEDHIVGQQQSAKTMAEFDTVRKAVEEEHDNAFQSLDVLIGHLEEHVKSAIFNHKISVASRIAGTGWEDPKTKKKLQGVETAAAWLASQTEIDENDGYIADVGEEILVQGRDACASFCLTTISMDKIAPACVTWLWPERFPMGKISLISGKPDNGKSQVTLDIIARTTTGADWPDGTKNELGPRDVLMAVAEDDLNDTVRPRLEAAGADLSRIKVINRIRTQEFDEKAGKKSAIRRLQLSDDIKKLKMAIEANPQVALVVVDTLTSFFGDVNANADQDIRPLMDALIRAFGDCKACFIGVIHHNKKNDADAIQSILGASSVAGAVRSAYSCSRDPENEDEFYFTLVKNNLTKKRSGMKYKIAEKTVGIISAPYVEWAGETEKNANDVMALAKEARDEKRHGVDKARLFIPFALQNGPRPARELYKEAEAEGISSDQMRRAKDQLAVKVTKQGNIWFWSLSAIEKSVQPPDVKEL